MFYVVGKISNKNTPPLYRWKEHGMRDPWDENLFKDAVAANYVGVSNDYAIYSASNDFSDAVKALKGNSYVLIWVENSITVLDFSEFDAKEWIRFYASKTSIVADNRDLSIISSKIYTANKSDMDNTYDGTIDVIVRSSTISAKALYSSAAWFTLVNSIKNSGVMTARGQPTGAGGEYLRINVDSVATIT